MVVSEPERNTQESWQGRASSLSPEMLPAQPHGAGRGILPWQNPSGGGGEDSFPFVPPACGFPSSDTEAMCWLRGVELPLPGEMQHLSGFPLHSFLPEITSPAWCFWVSRGTYLMGVGAPLLTQHRAGAGAGSPASLAGLQGAEQGRSCCGSPGLAPCTVS